MTIAPSQGEAVDLQVENPDFDRAVALIARKTALTKELGKICDELMYIDPIVQKEAFQAVFPNKH